MSGQIGYLYRCLREWQVRFGAWAGARIWLSVRLRKTLSSRDRMNLLLPGMAPIRLRCRGSDLACFEQIVVRDELSFRMPPDPNLIIDAGANIGLATVVLANRFPDATIVALEVDVDNFRMLTANTEHYRNVIPLNKALWHGNGYVKIANPSAAAWSFRVVETVASDPDAIPAVDIASILRDVGCDSVALLKMDIEGAEFEMFSNAMSWLPSVRMLAVEIHEGIRPGVTKLFDSAVRPAALACERHGEYDVLRFVA